MPAKTTTIGRRLAIVAIAALGAIAMAIPAMAAEKPAAVIKMSDTPPKYMPAKVTIKSGQTVEWINNAATLHDVNANPANAITKGDVVLPKGAKPFDSGFMTPGATFSHTFTTPGTYRYFCLPHEKDKMLGVIIVKKK